MCSYLYICFSESETLLWELTVHYFSSYHLFLQGIVHDLQGYRGLSVGAQLVGASMSTLPSTM